MAKQETEYEAAIANARLNKGNKDFMSESAINKQYGKGTGGFSGFLTAKNKPTPSKSVAFGLKAAGDRVKRGTANAVDKKNLAYASKTFAKNPSIKTTSKKTSTGEIVKPTKADVAAYNAKYKTIK